MKNRGFTWFFSVKSEKACRDHSPCVTYISTCHVFVLTALFPMSFGLDPRKFALVCVRKVHSVLSRVPVKEGIVSTRTD